MPLRLRDIVSDALLRMIARVTILVVLLAIIGCQQPVALSSDTQPGLRGHSLALDSARQRHITRQAGTDTLGLQAYMATRNDQQPTTYSYSRGYSITHSYDRTYSSYGRVNDYSYTRTHSWQVTP